MIKPNNASYKNKLEHFQYRSCIAITGSFQGMSQGRPYRQLGLESLTDTLGLENLSFFIKL